MIAKRLLLLAVTFISVCLLVACSTRQGQYIAKYDYEPLQNYENDSQANKINAYAQLQQAIIELVSDMQGSQTFNVDDYEGDLDSDMQTLTSYISENYPIGVYSVSEIGYEIENVLTNEQLEITLEYSKTAEQMQQIVSIVNTEELEEYISDMLKNGDSYAVLHIAQFYDADIELSERIYKRWMQNGAESVGLEGFSYSYYPEDRISRIIELKIDYLLDAEELAEHKAQISQVLDSVIGQTQQQMTVTEKIDFVYNYLWSTVAYDEQATLRSQQLDMAHEKTSTYTAYGALVEGVAAQEGFVLAAKAMLDRLEVDCLVIRGRADGEQLHWINFSSAGIGYYFDLTSGVQQSEVEQEQAILTEQGHITYPQGRTGYIYLFTDKEERPRFTWDATLYGIY